MSRRGSGYAGTMLYTSKNLEAERRRRQKLNDRLLALRAAVPVITNMNKGTIIKDAITYIQELQREVKVLTDMLLEMDQETSSEKGTTKRVDHENDAGEEVKQCGIKEDFQVTIVEGNKLWMRIIIEKKGGFFTRLIEKLTCFGLELADTNFTTFKGATLVSACVQGSYGDTLTAQQTKELLLQIIRGI